MSSAPQFNRQQSASSAQADVDYLLETSSALLSLTPSHLFRTYNDLSAYLKVASTQRNFSLRAVFEQPEFGKSDIRFRCQAFTTVGLPGTSDGACLSFWSVEQVGGYWRIAKAQINHNHILQEIIPPTPSTSNSNASTSSAAQLHSKQNHSDANGGMMGQNGSSVASCSHHGPNRVASSTPTYQGSSVSTPTSQGTGSMNGSAPVAQNGYSFNSNPNQPQPAAAVGPLPAEAHLVFQPNLTAKQAIADLRQTGSLAFPTFANQLSFPSHDAFRVYACAAALEQGFGLSLRNFGPQASLGRFTLQCITDMSRVQHLTPTPCPFEMTVVMLSRNGVVSWSIGRENQHSEACLKTRVVQQLDKPTVAIGQPIPSMPQLQPRPAGSFPVIPLVIRSAPPIPLVLPNSRPASTHRKIPTIRDDSPSSSSEEKTLPPLQRLHRGRPKGSTNSRTSSRYNSVAAAATTTTSGRKRVNYTEADSPKGSEESDFAPSPSRSPSAETAYLQKNLPTRRFSPVKLSPVPILDSASRSNNRYSPYNKPSSPTRTTFPTPSTSQDEFSPFTPVPTSAPSTPKFTVVDLKHFLHSLSPLLTQFAPVLFSHGLMSVKAIDNLISLDKESLELMIDGLAKSESENGMKGLHRVILRSKILDIQDRFNGVAIEGEGDAQDF